MSSMMGDSGGLGSSGDDTVVAGAHEGEEGGVFGSTSGEEDKGRGDDHEDGGDRNNCGGNRWPRQETLALLKIRSDMDAVFRDSSLKAPLWEEVSRKLGEIGYNRSAKKCKEKFENVYKYHKRTKDGRTGKAEGKNYRFFDQLQALENQPKPQTSIAVPWTNTPTVSQMITVPSTTNPTNMSQNAMITPISLPTIHPLPATTSPITTNPRTPLRKTIASSLQNISSNLFSSSTSSSTASDEEFKGGQLKRKRKWRNFFERLAREVIEKQEELQNKFLEAIDKHEHERIVREEAWRTQEMGRINREHEILVQERSTAAAKDAAVISFLQKISGQQYPTTQTHNNNLNIPTLLPPPPPPPPAMPRPPAPPPLSVTNSNIQKIDSCDTPTSSSSRWPKSEVQALIRLRTNLDIKYHENGPKGPLWEEISAGMRRLGYSRSAKRCKEKWENINKYFKKVKESNRKRPQDSKTCPYFHQLDALYKEKNKIDNSLSSTGYNNNANSINLMEPLMVQPEQQWPLQQENQHQQQEAAMEDIDHSKNGEDGDSSDEEEYEEAGGGYEIVTNNKTTSMEIVE